MDNLGDKFMEHILEIKGALCGLAENMAKLTENVTALTEIQIRQQEHDKSIERSFVLHERENERISEIEKVMPVFAVVKNIVFAGSAALLLAVVGAVFSLVLK